MAAATSAVFVDLRALVAATCGAGAVLDTVAAVRLNCFGRAPVVASGGVLAAVDEAMVDSSDWCGSFNILNRSSCCLCHSTRRFSRSAASLALNQTPATSTRCP